MGHVGKEVKISGGSEADEGTGGGDEDDVVTDFGERRERGVLTE
jgi:hypothetical protein|uniref:Uncharacterized protein n=1 Tax=Fagus sylvatica TaxID=28930 RepID=A0A2N9E586_FAGSY